MRRAMITAVAALGLAAVATPADAQVRFGGGIGLSAPSGDLADFTSTGWHGMLSLAVQPTGVPFGLRFDGVYHTFDFDEDEVSVDGSVRLLGGQANLMFVLAPASELRPYLSAGVGVYNAKAEFDDDILFPGDDEDSETKFGLNGGVGIQAALTGFTMFAEVRYLSIFTSDTNTNLIPVTIGILIGR
ncbi:MAG: outer membrane protein [Gemmatimonadaceae bacterium]